MAVLEKTRGARSCVLRGGMLAAVRPHNHPNWLLDSYVYGFAPHEATLPFDTAEEFTDMAESVHAADPR